MLENKLYIPLRSDETRRRKGPKAQGYQLFISHYVQMKLRLLLEERDKLIELYIPLRSDETTCGRRINAGSRTLYVTAGI